MLTRDEVIWGFRYCLGRDPESEETVLAHSGFSNWSSLRQALMKSDEYADGVGTPHLAGRWVLAPVMGGERLIWLELGDRYVSQACLLDNYEPAESAFLRRHLKPDSVFLDIGANIGWFTVLGSTLVGAGGRIHAFEPRPPTVARLRQTVQANRLEVQITIHDFALSGQSGEAFINWARDTDNPGGSFVSTEKLSETMESCKIARRTLDSLDLEPVDFIKMDVEGSEMDVVLGGERTIFETRPVIMTEVHPAALARVSKASPDEFLGFFSAHGYRVLLIDPGGGLFEIDRFPTDSHYDFINVGMFPS